jgi:hypothetical protein
VTCKTSDIDYALSRKGFLKESASHHLMYWFYLNGKKTSIRTKMSHGESEIGNPLISRMSHDLRLTKAEFLSFIECRINGDVYRNKMIVENQVGASQ